MNFLLRALIGLIAPVSASWATSDAPHGPCPRVPRELRTDGCVAAAAAEPDEDRPCFVIDTSLLVRLRALHADRGPDGDHLAQGRSETRLRVAAYESSRFLFFPSEDGDWMFVQPT